MGQATDRRADFCSTGADQAVFRGEDLEDAGLPEFSAHGVVCVDALGRARDRGAALRELGRVLTPDGRLVLSRASQAEHRPCVEPQQGLWGTATGRTGRGGNPGTAVTVVARLSPFSQARQLKDAPAARTAAREVFNWRIREGRWSPCRRGSRG
ncbi:methyltransferase domain-containing protein [Streptomyces sp. NPDC050263]|uniref:methyltransferase domain-containing protein n=1 Tax=Streptomyces sp. NPDC050263 TaxID=3155037 RepID=UPI00343E33AE